VTLAASMLDDDALRVRADGLELDLHLNWYRSLPVSSVRTLELALNGEPIAADELTFAVNGRESRLDELVDRWDETWFVLDPATIRVRRPLVRRGDAVDVHVRLGSRIPYILVAPDTPLEQVSERRRTLVAR
jgi:hypothetical protein